MAFQNLYIHFPFCRQKCLHCSFFSYPLSSQEELINYFKVLELEIGLYSQFFSGQTIETLYLGGGTPSLIPPYHLARLLEKVNNIFPFQPSCEITIEANPEDLSYDYLRAISSAGVNRLSVGWQSSFAGHLRALGRNEHLTFLADKLDIIRRAKITNINIDLIYGLPGQTMLQWEKNLLEVCRAAPKHISVYGLHLEEDVPLKKLLLQKKIAATPDEDTLLGMMLLAREILSSNKYLHYEIANYALPGYQSNHNMSYWQNKTYLALGPGAHGYLYCCRYANYCSWQQYKDSLLKRIFPCSQKERISRKRAMEEEMMLGLRLLEGISRQQFLQKYGLDPLHLFQTSILMLKEQGLLEVNDDKIKLTAKGLPLANLVFQEFIT